MFDPTGSQASVVDGENYFTIVSAVQAAEYDGRFRDAAQMMSQAIRASIEVVDGPFSGMIRRLPALEAQKTFALYGTPELSAQLQDALHQLRSWPYKIRCNLPQWRNDNQVIDAMRKAFEHADGSLTLEDLRTIERPKGTSRLLDLVDWLERDGYWHMEDDTLRPGPLPPGAPRSLRRPPRKPPPPLPDDAVPPVRRDPIEKKLNQAQAAFYKKVLAGIENGQPVDLDGQAGYLDLYINHARHQFGDSGDRETYEAVLDKIHELHGEDAEAKITESRIELHRWYGEFDKAWELQIQRGTTADNFYAWRALAKPARASYAEFEAIYTARDGDGKTIRRTTAGHGLTTFGADRPALVIVEFDNLLDEFTEIHGTDIFNYIQKHFRHDRSIYEMFPAAQALKITQHDLEHLHQVVNAHPEDLPEPYDATKPHPVTVLFPGTRRRKTLDPPKQQPDPLASHIELIVYQQLNREAENRVRENMAIPRIGEGWVSEMLLYQRIKEAFPDQEVVHQGRPRWLGRQSLDIWIPEHNIGIEYQGAQHSQPVAYFGGQQQFEAQKQRDQRKRDPCEANGCALVEVHPAYHLQDVIDQIQALLVPRALTEEGGT